MLVDPKPPLHSLYFETRLTMPQIVSEFCSAHKITIEEGELLLQEAFNNKNVVLNPDIPLL